MMLDIAPHSEVNQSTRNRAEPRPSLAALSPRAASDAVSAFQLRSESVIFTDNPLVVNDLKTKMKKYSVVSKKGDLDGLKGLDN